MSCYITIVFGTCPGAINEVSMRQVFEKKNGKIYVEVPETCDRDRLRKVTEEFLRKALYGGSRHGDSNSSRNFSEK